MMRLTSRQIAAYHRQIERLRAYREMRLLRVQTAPNSAESLRELQMDLTRAARGIEPKKSDIVVISNQAELTAFMKKAARGE